MTFVKHIFKLLEKVYSFGGIRELVDVREEYAISRAIRGGSFNHTANVQVNPVIINFIN